MLKLFSLNGRRGRFGHSSGSGDVACFSRRAGQLQCYSYSVLQCYSGQSGSGDICSSSSLPPHHWSGEPIVLSHCVHCVHCVPGFGEGLDVQERLSRGLKIPTNGLRDLVERFCDGALCSDPKGMVSNFSFSENVISTFSIFSTRYHRGLH